MKVAVMGYGTVGSGVVEVIEHHSDIIPKRTGGKTLEISHILDLRDFPNDPHKDLFTKDFNDILNDDETKIVAETMGGVNPAFDFTMKLLKAGKSVVTSNKELVAQRGLELLQAAEESGANYLFEASVGGGIPIIRPLCQCLAANYIEGIAGILNGTTNFILTMMIEEGMSFEEALKIAQEKGYAEKVYPNQVETEGITKISLEDVSYIENAGGVIKLLGQIKYINDNEIAAFVSPAVVYNGSQLASVKDVFNAILVRGDAVGDVCFYGPGAGKLPTASAVVADIIDCAKHSDRKKIFGWGEGSENYVVDYKEKIEMPFYVRAKATPNEVNSKFADVKFLSRKGQPSDEVAFITDYMTENKLNKKLDGMNVINTIKVTNY